LGKICQEIFGQFFPELTEEEGYDWFQQYSATAHTARMSVQALSDDFGDRNIGSGIWPARSPDRNPRDFFFWDCLKDKICNSTLSAEELKENVRRKIKNIPGEQLQNVNQNFFSRYEECLRVEGTAFSAPPVICEM
jgi:hypothetical protein